MSEPATEAKPRTWVFTVKAHLLLNVTAALRISICSYDTGGSFLRLWVNTDINREHCFFT